MTGKMVRDFIRDGFGNIRWGPNLIGWNAYSPDQKERMRRAMDRAKATGMPLSSIVPVSGNITNFLDDRVQFEMRQTARHNTPSAISNPFRIHDPGPRPLDALFHQEKSEYVQNDKKGTFASKPPKGVIHHITPGQIIASLKDITLLRELPVKGKLEYYVNHIGKQYMVLMAPVTPDGYYFCDGGDNHRHYFYGSRNFGYWAFGEFRENNTFVGNFFHFESYAGQHVLKLDNGRSRLSGDIKRKDNKTKKMKKTGESTWFRRPRIKKRLTPRDLIAANDVAMIRKLNYRGKLEFFVNGKNPKYMVLMVPVTADRKNFCNAGKNHQHYFYGSKNHGYHAFGRFTNNRRNFKGRYTHFDSTPNGEHIMRAVDSRTMKGTTRNGGITWIKGRDL